MPLGGLHTPRHLLARKEDSEVTLKPSACQEDPKGRRGNSSKKPGVDLNARAIRGSCFQARSPGWQTISFNFGFRTMHGVPAPMEQVHTLSLSCRQKFPQRRPPYVAQGKNAWLHPISERTSTPQTTEEHSYVLEGSKATELGGKGHTKALGLEFGARRRGCTVQAWGGAPL